MLRLLLLRHSKAVPFTGSGDYERPLTGRGRADAARLGAFIAEEKIAPQAAFHSGAKRSKETLAIALTKMPRGVPALVEPRLYEASDATFLGVVRDGADSIQTRLLVGHNPSIGETACRLAGAGDPRALMNMASKFPTSALAVIDFELDRWRDVDVGAGRLFRFATPAALSAEDD